MVLLVLLAACASASPTQPRSAPDAGAINLAPRVAPRPAGGDPIWLPLIPNAARARALVDLPLNDTPGGQAQVPDVQPPISIGQDLAVLGDPVIVNGAEWLRVYVVAQPGGSGDVFTWIPAKQEGQDTVSPPQVDDCPPTRDNLSTIAALNAFTRAQCLGPAPFTVEGSTSTSRLEIAYQVKPSWLGPRLTDPPSPSLVTRPPGPVDVRVPPGLDAPPADITVRAELHVLDPASGSCTRTAVPNSDVPVESAADTRLWCAVQVVMDRWEPLLGPEGRPFDAAAPQLHRFHPGNCELIGMGTVVFHTDPTRLDPVWADPVTGGPPLPAWFGPEFHIAFQPGLVVVDDKGEVVVSDGLILDATGRLGSHFVCATTDALYIN